MNEFINQLYEKYEGQLNTVFGYSDYYFIITNEDENSPHPITCRYQESL